MSRPHTDRCRVSLLAVALIALLLPCAAVAQEPSTVRLAVEPAPGDNRPAVRAGFRSYEDPAAGLWKAGLWAPVYVTFTDTALTGKKNRGYTLPLGPDGYTDNELGVIVPDGDDVQALYTSPLQVRAGATNTVLSYANAGSISTEFRFSILPGRRALPGQRTYTFRSPPLGSVGMNEHIYVALGREKVEPFYQALLQLTGLQEPVSSAPRHLGYEADADLLPDLWFGYDAVDLAVLFTSDRAFIQKLAQSPDRAAALARWVGRGGRLLVSVSPQNQQWVHQLLRLWQPAFPDVLPPDAQAAVDSMAAVHNWAGANTTPFPAGPADVAAFRVDRSAEPVIAAQSGEPLVVRIPYGRGSVTLTGFALDEGPFQAWEEAGQVEFWRRVVTQLAPPAVAVRGDGPQGGFAEAVGNDVATELHRELDRFDVPMISFGWVALFILVYILIVGPLDYFVLKKVFKRLEWTWVTFPTIVLVISVAAYFTAYALKGRDLRVNKVDLIDIDMRTDLDDGYRPASAYVYGNTWFSILSPRVQNYTVGLDPVIVAGRDADEAANPNHVMLTWLGRPQAAGPGGFGRQGGQMLFRREYRYADQARGMIGVPIPVWTTRAFAGAWEGRLAGPPLEVDLYYDPASPRRLSGSIRNRLPADLYRVFVVFGDSYYPLDAKLAGAGAGSPKVELERVLPVTPSDIGSWSEDTASPGPADPWEGESADGDGQTFDPAAAMKSLYFYSKRPTAGTGPNHALRRLDLSWHLRVPLRQEESVHTAVIVAQLARVQGDSEELTADDNSLLPTQLWLQGLPGEGQRPRLSGRMTQETFVRVLVPVRPKRSE